MLRRCLTTLLLPALLALTAQSQAQEINKAQLLYETYCQQCHDSQIHMREKKRAQDLEDIRHFVKRWQNSLELKWTERDIDQVADYINQRYYHY